MMMLFAGKARLVEAFFFFFFKVASSYRARVRARSILFLFCSILSDTLNFYIRLVLQNRHRRDAFDAKRAFSRDDDVRVV